MEAGFLSHTIVDYSQRDIVYWNVQVKSAAGASRQQRNYILLYYVRYEHGRLLASLWIHTKWILG